ncbi:hypothetical protein ABIF63_005524 [Bradyrhizobium japonicum]|uniref:Uncharacterized protein n=1 Tax=Bradyrhizobium japonicum TaxID=375 RepID=A0ABV2RWV8_BRAJP
MQHCCGQCDRVDRIPDDIRAPLLLRTPQQLQSRRHIDRAGKSVVGTNAKPVSDRRRDEALRALRDRLADIGVGARECHGIERALDQVRDVVAEVGRPEANAIAKQGLLEAGVVSDAFLGPEVGICKEEERGKAHVELVERRRLEPRAVASLANVHYQNPTGFLQPALGVYGGIRLANYDVR